MARIGSSAPTSPANPPIISDDWAHFVGNLHNHSAWASQKMWQIYGENKQIALGYEYMMMNIPWIQIYRGLVTLNKQLYTGQALGRTLILGDDPSYLN